MHCSCFRELPLDSLGCIFIYAGDSATGNLIAAAKLGPCKTATAARDTEVEGVYNYSDLPNDAICGIAGYTGAIGSCRLLAASRSFSVAKPLSTERLWCEQENIVFSEPSFPRQFGHWYTVREFIDGRWTGAWLTKPLDVFETREPEVETASGSGSRALPSRRFVPLDLPAVAGGANFNLPAVAGGEVPRGSS